MKKYLMEIVVFVCGGMIMILELIAARIMSPYVGSSNTVWTSIIGVILISMSLGYWLGGKLADNKPEQKFLSALILASAVLISLIPILETVIIKTVSIMIPNLSLSAIISVLLTFALPSSLLATISPYAIKLKEADAANVGQIAGRLSALSTLGSITGTFLTGFFLIPAFGNKMILLVSALILFIISLLLYCSRSIKFLSLSIGCLIIIMVNVFTGQELFASSNPDIIKDTDSQYSRIWIVNDADNYKYMQIDRAVESYIDSNGKMGSRYLEYYDLFNCYNPQAAEILMIGGAAYTYPSHFLSQYPDKNIDVVEIDAKTTELAREYFNLTDNPRLNIFHQDGRSYLNTCTKKYDTILIDAFKGFNVPFELTTVEALNKMKDSLNENGMVIANVISAVEGSKAGFAKAQLASFNQVFETTKIFKAAENNPDSTEKQNLVIIGFKSGNTTPGIPDSQQYKEYLDTELTDFSSDYEPFTDDHAPVDQYI